MMEQGSRDPSQEAFVGGRWWARKAWDDDPTVADEAVGRVLVLGDIHNSDGVLHAALTFAEFEGCDAVLSVGDFWLQDCSWDTRLRTQSARYPSTAWSPLMRSAMRADLPIVVVDGNHEVWPCLADYEQRPDVIQAKAAGRPLHLGGTLWWADRGSTWTWSGRRCGALGGAVSPDKFIDRLASHRWPDHEAPNRSDLARLLTGAAGDLDVLFCHDAPAGVKGLKGMPDSVIPIWIRAECREVQDLLQDAVVGTEPRLVFHGHWHQRNHERLRAVDTEVFGLANDGRDGCMAILDLRDLSGAYYPR